MCCRSASESHDCSKSKSLIPICILIRSATQPRIPIPSSMMITQLSVLPFISLVLIPYSLKLGHSQPLPSLLRGMWASNFNPSTPPLPLSLEMPPWATKLLRDFGSDYTTSTPVMPHSTKTEHTFIRLATFGSAAICRKKAQRRTEITSYKQWARVGLG